MGSIVYIHDDKLINECNKIPPIVNRATVVEDLINSYNLLTNEKLVTFKCIAATEEELKSFHASNYIDFLMKVNNESECSYEDLEEEQDEFGLCYDCPLLEKMYDFARTIAGGSITAAKLLAFKKAKICINWCGGWHHAQRDAAEGFCYINDVVLAIQELSKTFEKILYLDFDIHHGNGVENAFSYSKKVLTVSLHKVATGFYPGTGLLDQKWGKNVINIPFLEGVCDKTYLTVFSKIFPLILEKFKPKALVVQCGADGLIGDPVGECNLTTIGIGECVKSILACDLPTLFLGGGGYNIPNTARLWTYLTSVIMKINLDNDIPDESEFFTYYGPSYELHIEAGFQKDLNTDEYLNKLIESATRICQQL